MARSGLFKRGSSAGGGRRNPFIAQQGWTGGMIVRLDSAVYKRTRSNKDMHFNEMTPLAGTADCNGPTFGQTHVWMYDEANADMDSGKMLSLVGALHGYNPLLGETPKIEDMKELGETLGVKESAWLDADDDAEVTIARFRAAADKIVEKHWDAMEDGEGKALAGRLFLVELRSSKNGFVYPVFSAIPDEMLNADRTKVSESFIEMIGAEGWQVPDSFAEYVA